MGNSWQLYREFRTIIKEKVQISFIYIVFLIDCFMLWQPEYILLIHASKWIPNNIQKIFLTFFNFLYSHFLWLVIPIFTASIIIILLFDKTTFFNFLPEDVDMVNGETVSWNPISAFRRLIDIVILFCTEYWIYWLTLNVFLNPHQFTINIFNTELTTNPLITSNYLTVGMLETTFLLFVVNMGITLKWILRSLFETRLPTDRYSISNNKLDMYIEIASFEKELHGEYTKTMILKPKYNKKALYLLVNGESDRYKNSFRYSMNKNEIPYNKKHSTIINSSADLSEIIYHFEELKRKQHEN